MICPYCNSRNIATTISKPYKTYCLDCKKEIWIKSKIANLLELMEDLDL